MSSLVGKIQEFKPENERFSTYVDRLKLYFEANSVANEKKVAVFLTVIGSRNYALLSDHFAPAKPNTKSLDQLVAALQSYFEPEPMIIAERFLFHKRDQKPGESISDFAAELRRLATSCKFKQHLDEALRDRFICGLNMESVQKRLLLEKDLTMSTALELALSISSAERTSRAMNSSKPTDQPVNQFRKNGPAKRPCYRCGRNGHTPDQCRLREATCHTCGKVGHIAPVCKSAPKKESPKTPNPGTRNYPRGPKSKENKFFQAEDSEASDSEPLFTVGEKSHPPIMIHLKLNNQDTVMELDTGAAMSLISERTKKSLFPRVELRPSNIVLRTYTSERVSVLGELDVHVQYQDQSSHLTVLVVSGSGPSLIDRDWMSQIRFNWVDIKRTRCQQEELQSLINKYPEVFKNELGTMVNFKVSLDLKPEARPKFFRPRPVPFALRDNIETELQRLEDANIISKVSHSDWAAPIVAVPKKDGKLRLCGDYKVTINPVLQVDQHPLPKPDDLFSTLSGGKIFSKIDLSHAYQQMPLDEKSKSLVTINTHRGLFRYNRLPFGVASAPAVFQRAMDTILQGIPHVICYIDDILVSGSTYTDHLNSLQEVFRRLAAEGITVKRSKCSFLTTQVEYLGHVVDQNGLHSSDKKLEAILNAPTPKNVQQLRSLLGMVNYYGKFVSNLASRLHPLNHLLKSNVKWKWTTACTKALSEVKRELVSSRLLVHYDSDLPLQLATDASAYGVGAVISHVFPNGEEKPIAFASRTLTPAEKNYPQIEKEALSIVFGVKKFHQYLYARQFSLITDHKPLVAILHPSKAIPPLSAARMQRWALLLSAYSYSIHHRSTQQHANADALSRLPLQSDLIKEDSCGVSFDSVFNLGQLEALPVTSQQISQATSTDPLLSQVIGYVKQGWPGQVSPALKPYFTRRDELTLEDNCLMWGIRVIVPAKFQQKVLTELHEDHPGISRMKSLARSYVWWPSLDADIEALVKSCLPCLSVKPSPPKSPLNPWLWPSKPWSRIHVDFAGPLNGKMYFVIIDAHSKWPEVFEMSSTTSTKTIDVLRHVFAQHGLPDQLVSDNGPQFTSDDFKHFLRQNGIKHTRTAPYHPATNGIAERFVQTLKRGILAGRGDARSSQHKLASFLLHYRTTPHTVTGVPPSVLLNNRHLKTVLSLLKPDVSRRVQDRQELQKRAYDNHAQERTIEVDELVMVKVHRQNHDYWEPGTVIEKVSPVSFVVELLSGAQRRCHIDQLRKRRVQSEAEQVETSDSSTQDASIDSNEHRSPSPDSDSQFELIPAPVTVQQPENSSAATSPRYPARNRRPPDRYF